MSQHFLKGMRLRKRRQFQRMGNHAVRKEGGWIVVECRKNRNGKTRLGITVTRRYGKAHDRNRFKRVVREAFRILYSQLPNGLDLNIKPRGQVTSISMWDIMCEIKKLMSVNEQGLFLNGCS